MTRVALIDARDKKIIPETENLGLANITSFLRKHDVEVNLFSMDSGSNPGQQAANIGFQNDIYGFSLFHSNVDFLFETAKKIKQEKPGALICVGGRLAAEAADSILADCDAVSFVVLGDGEIPLLNAARLYPDLDKISGLKNIKTRKSPGPKEMARMTDIENARPARDLAYSAAGRPSAAAHLYRKRGCTRACSFCLVNGTGQKKLKKYHSRSCGDIFSEIRSLYSQNGFRAFMFHDCPFDDGGTSGIAWIEELCDLILTLEEPLAFECLIDGKFFDENRTGLVKKMRKAGFSQIMYLLGSGNDFDLNILKGKRHPGISEKEKSIEGFSKNDIEVMLEFFTLNPLSTLESLGENYRFLMRRCSYRLGDFIRRAPVYVGTPLHRTLVGKGLLKPRFSYKTPFEYRYENGYLQEVDRFFRETLFGSQLLVDDYNFQNLVYLYNWLRVLFPQSMESIKNEIDAVKKKLHAVLGDYFAEIMINRSLESAVQHFKEFEKAVSQIYSGVKSFQLRLFRQKGIREYLLRQ